MFLESVGQHIELNIVGCIYLNAVLYVQLHSCCVYVKNSLLLVHSVMPIGVASYYFTCKNFFLSFTELCFMSLAAVSCKCCTTNCKNSLNVKFVMIFRNIF